ncbi:MULTISPECIES: hypothetical protein [Rheinheimera]|uniref:LRAT domain-containing protein n=1 Tax=Rheinheimera marina TaxID=1774958 RepID=A0ABV9JIG0_9GAMM
MKRNLAAFIATVPPGAVVCCEIYHLFEHSGIYVGDGQVIELAGSGLVRALSLQRFLDQRSGEELHLATEPSGKIIGSAAAAERALVQVYSYQSYDLLRNNCHRFTYACVSGQSLPVTSFFDLKQELMRYWRFSPGWHQFRLD